ncbi:hypothetical protein FB561_5003 [Kribbella amoyensis]|uniref:Uncharacterized protein n=1 Tax=Kribbella amoyensis TaxID=996641 RepID=A0A561BY68_9ACTN|nr:hypothetical protein [Kribbella amoyensis]TWD83834.1 hypothetical protein FB561_5003 [Kribbella amoyensis]
MPLVDLDDPDELRARWSALAAVAHATGFDRRWYADEQGWYHQDETGSDLRMVRLDGGRAIVFGYHTEHSRTAGTDLVAGAPDWIGQPEVKRRIAAGQLGFVYGSFNGTWARAAYEGDPWQPADDGFHHIATWVTSDEDAAEELAGWASQWAGHRGSPADLVPAATTLIRAAGSDGLTFDGLRDFFEELGIGPRSPLQPDLRAGLIAAEQFKGVSATEATAYVDSLPGPTARAAEVDAAAEAEVEEEEEELFIVPPGVSPFTGQPIDDAPYKIEPPYDEGPSEPSSQPSYGASYGVESYEPEPASQPEQPPAVYGVVSRKRRFGRKRKREEENASLANLGLTGPDPEPDPEPEGPRYDRPLPSSEPPRVGSPVAEGEDYYASLFADGPSAAASSYTPDTDTDEVVWSDENPFVQKPAQQWPDQATSEFNPFADETGVLPPADGKDEAQADAAARQQAPAPPQADAPESSTLDDTEDTGVIPLIEDPPAGSGVGTEPEYPAEAEPQPPNHAPAWGESGAQASSRADAAAQSPNRAEDQPQSDEQAQASTWAEADAQAFSAPSAVELSPEQVDAAALPDRAETERQAEQQRVDEQRRAEEQARVAEQQRQAYEQRRAEEQARAAEEQRRADERRRADAQQHAEEQQRVEQQQRADAQSAAGGRTADVPRPNRDWVGGAWINGEWIEDAAAYLAANPHVAPPHRSERPASRLPDADQSSFFGVDEDDLDQPFTQAAPEPPQSANNQPQQPPATPPAAEYGDPRTAPTEDTDADVAWRTPSRDTEDAHGAEDDTDLRGAADLPGAGDLRDTADLRGAGNLRGTGDARSAGDVPGVEGGRGAEAVGGLVGEADALHDGGTDFGAEAASERSVGDGADADSAWDAAAVGDAGGAAGRPVVEGGSDDDVDWRSTAEAQAGVEQPEVAGAGEAEQVSAAGADGALADEAPTAEIPVVTDGPVETAAAADGSEEGATHEADARADEVVEEEYYPTSRSPFAPVGEADESPFAGRFSAVERQPEEDFGLAGDEFHDELIGDADWTADQLGDSSWAPPRPAEHGSEAAPGASPQAVSGPTDEDEPDEGVWRGFGARASDGAEEDAQPTRDGSQSDDVAAAPEGPANGADAGAADGVFWPAGWVAGAGAVAGAEVAGLGEGEAAGQLTAAETATEESADADNPAVTASTDHHDATSEADSGSAEQAGATESAAAEKLVAPAPSSGMVIPGLGLVGGDGPRVEVPAGSLEEAMRSEYERPRPRPKESAAFAALREWCRARTAIVPSGFTIQVQVLDPAAPSYRFDLEPPPVDDPEYAASRLSALLGELWLTESQSEQGGWLFARIDAAGRTVRVDRWYDQVPDWWDHPLPPEFDIEGLVRRLYRRGPDWQPSYLERLYTTAR